MRLVPTPETNSTPATETPRRLYFLHIPKTAGITVMRYLADHYAPSDALIIDEWTARELPPAEVQRHAMFSGHYSAEVLRAMGERPFTVTLIREPLARFDSWSAHCRRVSHRKYRDMFEGATDLEVLTGPHGYTCRQAHWLARALRTGADDTTIPRSDELYGLLANVDVVGVTDEVERFMQLVSFHMGWPPPPRGWHVNRRPTEDRAADPRARPDTEDAVIRRELAIDAELYDLARQRFWNSYVTMVGAISPDRTSFTPATAAQIPLGTVQEWLRAHHANVLAAALPREVETIDVGAGDPIAGEGWWWRTGWPGFEDRWTGPDTQASWLLPSLAPHQRYDVTIEALCPADLMVWEGATLEVNGRPVPVVRERSSPCDAHRASYRLHATLSPEVVSAQDPLTRVVLQVPETKQSLVNLVVCESFDTYHHDERFVGIAVQRLRIQPAAGLGLETWGSGLRTAN